MEQENQTTVPFDSEPGKIVLHWRISAFLPALADFNDIRTVSETLYSKEFESGNTAREYWSVPERLIDIRWITEEQTQPAGEGIMQRPPWHQKYGQLEFLLYRIVTKLAEWCGSCGKNADRLIRGNDREDDWGYIRQEDADFLRNFFKRHENSGEGSYSDEELTRMSQLAEEFLSLKLPDERSRRLKSSAKRLRELRRRWEEPPGQLSVFAPDDTDEKRAIFEQMILFSRQATDFLENSLWRREDAPIKNLRELERNIQRILPEWKPEEKEKLSQAYVHSLWTGLQSVADEICKIINGQANKPTRSVEELLLRVEEAKKRIGIGTRANTKLESDYFTDKKRCVALLECKDRRILAFSGFLDCEDPQVQRVLDRGANTELIADFRKISAALQTTLATLTTGVVDRMVRRELDGRFAMVQRGPMRAEIPASRDEKQISFLKRAYSCCERKILAELAVQGNVKNTKARLLVKFEPCLKCYGVVEAWRLQNHIELTLDYSS